MDTYARLLYKTGNANQAIEWEGKAIDLQKKRALPTSEYEKVLANMKIAKENIEE